MLDQLGVWPVQSLKRKSRKNSAFICVYSCAVCQPVTDRSGQKWKLNPGFSDTVSTAKYFNNSSEL